MSGMTCIECCEPVVPGEKCARCALRLIPSTPTLASPPTPAMREDLSEPPPLPPYAHCTRDGTDPELPENAGRHPAPVPFDETTDTIQYLRDLRGAAGTPRRVC